MYFNNTHTHTQSMIIIFNCCKSIANDSHYHANTLYPPATHCRPVHCTEARLNLFLHGFNLIYLNFAAWILLFLFPNGENKSVRGKTNFQKNHFTASTNSIRRICGVYFCMCELWSQSTEQFWVRIAKLLHMRRHGSHNTRKATHFFQIKIPFF